MMIESKSDFRYSHLRSHLVGRSVKLDNKIEIDHECFLICLEKSKLTHVNMATKCGFTY